VEWTWTTPVQRRRRHPPRTLPRATLDGSVRRAWREENKAPRARQGDGARDLVADSGKGPPRASKEWYRRAM